MNTKPSSENNIFVLKVFQKQQHLEVSAFERKGPLRNFVEHRFREDEVDRCHQELIALFNKCNRQGEISQDQLKKLKALGQLLYDELLPLTAKQSLNSTQAEYLILDVDDKLNHLPWELLFDGSRFLCLRFSMGRIIRTTDVPQAAKSRNLNSPLKMLVLFDPKGDLAASWGKDELTEGELILDFLSRQNSLAADFKGSPIDGNYLKMYLRDYDLIHYAGHAEYDLQAVEKSGWLLSDKKLLASDIVKMQGVEKSFPSLVFSNACQSGIAGKWKALNIYDLAKAFLITGAQHYIGTLWDILNKTSSHLALAFYAELVQGKPVGEALKNARLQTIQAQGEKSIIWASYILYGDPTVTYLNQASVEQTDRLQSTTSDIKRGTCPKPVTAVSKKTWMSGAVLSGVVLLFWVAFRLHHSQEDALLNRKYKAALEYLESGNYSAAITLSRELEKLNPGTAYSSIILGDVFLVQGNLSKAVIEYTNAAEGASSSSQEKSLAYNRLGRLYSSQNNYKQALAYYDQAISHNSQDSQLYFNKGMLCKKIGDYPQAQRQFDQVLHLNPQDRLAAVFKEEIGQCLADLENSERKERIDKLINELVEAYHNQNRPRSVTGEKSDTLPTITFLDFKSRVSVTSPEGEDEYILLKTIEYLNRSGQVKVVERQLVAHLLEELKLGASALADPQVSIRLGKILAAKVIITGNIIREGSRFIIGMRLIETETTAIRAAIAETPETTLSLDEIARILADKIVGSIQR
ncbi:MAG: tetratricopeptide repeat protein [Candidatus Schekmanbacteria bacterium]|nr:tetratricopeptide repeat protein [Candidatus Schekmanbacteria bacterium]